MKAEPTGISLLKRQLDEALSEATDGGGTPPTPPLPPANFGGTPSGMEPRIATLEAQMDRALSELGRLSGLPETVGRLDERVRALPDKDWVGAKMRNWVGGVGVILAALMTAFKFIH